MAGLTASPRRAGRTPGRPSRALASIEPAAEPPSKRRKFASGGQEGGEHPNDADNGTISNDSLANSLSHTAPRARPRREASHKQENGETPYAPRSAMQTRPRRERPERYAPNPTTPRPRYTNAAAAAAASQASDGYKPREERSWEDFHPDLDIDAGLLVYTADEIDGRSSKDDPTPSKQALPNGEAKAEASVDVEMKDREAGDSEPRQQAVSAPVTPIKRRPGRPPRKLESMLSGLGSPPAPRIVPLPTHNPKERLNLPKPSFRQYNHFLQYEEDAQQNRVNYVDRTMSHVGYQESDRFELPPRGLMRLTEGQQIEDEADVGLKLESDGITEAVHGPPVVARVEYDMDEQDVAWLEDINEQRRIEGVDAIKPAILEITMTQIEKEYHALEKRIPKPQPRHAQMHRPRSSSQAAVNGDTNPPGEEPDSKCAICDDGDCENANAIIFCDGCDLAVHQECYGVPFIPEGQWFCRKCKEIGRGTPTCIFCPNVDGAFKQTSTLRWSHLLCALWIPEVTIANMTFMEPIQDVDKVPKGRWRLHCYICNQRMGACIQCGNKNCYLAFHVTCARRAKLFLKMKSPHQAGLDTTALRAFCDKHVPPDWRELHDTDNAIQEARRWYRHAFKDRKWADSQTAALELGAPHPPDGGLSGDGGLPDDTIAVSKRRRVQSKQAWRLPSGAPVVPAVVFQTVEASLQRFTIRKRKEFVEKACKYWTLKREARRGAALLKRLQLQADTFSSMEITRRNFAGMGSIGRQRLQRRIQFAELLQKDMMHLKDLCAQARKREELRLRELELLRELVDTVYFPISALLAPILQRAQKLDEKSHIFTSGFEVLSQRLHERYYTSISDFSRDLSDVFAQALASRDHFDAGAAGGIDAIHSQLNEVRPGTAEHLALTQEQKDLKRLAKRIVKAVKEPLEQALRKEAELHGREHEEELRKLDSMGIFASKALDGDGDDDLDSPVKRKTRSDDSPDANAKANADHAAVHFGLPGREAAGEVPNSAPKTATHSHSSSLSDPPATGKNTSSKAAEPLSPPTSRSSSAAGLNQPAHDFLAYGGVPWYLTPFDPVGTTIHDERYTGRAVLRDMSEELSDMDEDTLTELAGMGHGAMGTPAAAKGRKTRARATKAATKESADVSNATDPAAPAADAVVPSPPAKKQIKKKKSRRMNW